MNSTIDLYYNQTIDYFNCVESLDLIDFIYVLQNSSISVINIALVLQENVSKIESKIGLEYIVTGKEYTFNLFNESLIIISQEFI